MSKKIQLKNVRLSFPSIFNKSVFDGKEGKYEATFLLSKEDVKTKKRIDELIQEVLREAKIKVNADKICVKDGDDVEYDGYADNWSIKASSKLRPTVVNKDKSAIIEDDEIIYAGCYVNAIIDFWVQNNSYGKRVNANLYGIQFVKDGEPFGKNDIDVVDEFEDIDDEL
jgi:hypothetical protein